VTLPLQLLLALLSIPALLACGYLLCASALSMPLAVPVASSRRLRFDVIVPAHNEAAIIARSVGNLRTLDWPSDGFRIWVIADNCTDATAGIAAAAGAQVLERADLERRGKGYALEFAFAASRSRGWADAVVVIDADAEASADLLEAFAARIERGASAIQAHYGVLNPHDSWRTRLITIAKASFHIVRSRARERLSLSCGIRGNGWCVTHALLLKVPYKAFSLTEDLEYGIDLGLAGVRVHYADEAHADADMVTGENIARKQRQRWENGRFQLVRSKTLPLLSAAFRRRDAVCLDLALDLIVLPLSYVTLNVAALILVAGLGALWFPGFAPWFWCGIACAASIVLYVLRGWQLSGIGAQGLLDLARAPLFLLWRILSMLRRRKSQEWVRTDREPARPVNPPVD
jgi:cellulose synthase/poly-beta-1,6-N-acetylglucosamine synthase-like glycosyltransferase